MNHLRKATPSKQACGEVFRAAGPSPGWNQEAIAKLLPSEKHIGRVLLKTISTCLSQIKNIGLMDRYL